MWLHYDCRMRLLKHPALLRRWRPYPHTNGCLADNTKKSRKYNRSAELPVRPLCTRARLLFIFSFLTPGSATSSLAQQFCRPRSCCPRKHKEKRVGRKRKVGGWKWKRPQQGERRVRKTSRRRKELSFKRATTVCAPANPDWKQRYSPPCSARVGFMCLCVLIKNIVRGSFTCRCFRAYIWGFWSSFNL